MSIRARIVLWHLLGGLTIAIVLSIAMVCVLAVTVERNMQQAMVAAARQLPDVVSYYVGRDRSLKGAAGDIERHFAVTGVLAMVIADGQQVSHVIADRRLPPVAKDSFGKVGLLEALLMNVPPLRQRVRGGVVFLHGDPVRFQLTATYLPYIVLGIFVSALGVAWALGSVTAARVLDPLISTTRALNRFGNGDFRRQPLVTDDRSETSNLARAYNGAVDAIVLAFAERERAEAEMRQFVADAGHQLRTPLTVIMGHLSAVSLGVNGNGRGALDNMLQESRRMRALIEDLIALARLEDRPEARELVDMHDVIHHLVDSYEKEHPRAVRLVAAEHGLVATRESEAYGVLRALVDNALKYGGGSAVEIDSRRAGDWLNVLVMDRGPGLSEVDLERAFDRFYRGENGYGVEGSGLGLSIVKRSVARARGDVTLRNRPGGGLVCHLRFNLTPTASAIQ